MEINIREARVEDMSAVLELIKELAIFEKEPEAVEVSIDNLVENGFKNDLFRCFVAEVENIIVGMALVYLRYSTWKGVVLHLEDLIVNENYRGNNIGTILLDRVVEYGKELKVKRIVWDVLDWNEPAIKFYENKGAKVLKEWRVVHLDEEGINNY